MDLYAQQQFDHLLHTAAARFGERLEHRYGSASMALAALNGDPMSSSRFPANAPHHARVPTSIEAFVDALFDDFLLANTEGACFILSALANRPSLPPPCASGQSVETTLVAWSKTVFAGVLKHKTSQWLEQRTAFEPVEVPPQ